MGGGYRPAVESMTAIHEIRQVLWVETPHGYGLALFLIDYGPHENTVYVVALEDTRKIKHYSSEQIKFGVNHTFGFADRVSNDERKLEG